MLVVAAIAIALGSFFRCTHLDRKVYGFDESVTLVRMSGATLPEFVRAFSRGELASTGDARARFERVRPGDSAAATIRSLATDDPQHPPLYYLLERGWQRLGTSLATERSLAVVFGMLLLPASYWLARRLFDARAALATVALVAVSPFHVVFAQYNREYSLWALLTVVSSASLVDALRFGGLARFALYGVGSILALYTDPFFAYVLAAHALFVVYRVARGRPSGAFAFAATLVLALVAYAPWLAVIARGWHVISSTTAWNEVPLPLALMLGKWAFETSAVFVDAEYASLVYAPLALLGAGIAVAAIVAGTRALRHGDGRTDEGYAFAWLVVACATLPLVVPDLLLHESRSTAARYLTPTWLGIELLVAAGIASIARSRPRTASAGLGALVLCGAFSLATSAPRESWWIDSHDAPLVAIARHIDATPGARLCFVDNDESLLVLVATLAHDVPIDRIERPGCLAVGTSSAVAARFRGSGGVVAFAPTDPSAAPLDRVHAVTARAHGVGYEPSRLWRFVGARRSRAGTR